MHMNIILKHEMLLFIYELNESNKFEYYVYSQKWGILWASHLEDFLLQSTAFLMFLWLL